MLITREAMVANCSPSLGATDADDGHEAATLRAFLPVAEEEFAAASGAEVANEDIGGAEVGA